MSDTMKTAGNALPHIQFGPEPVRCVVVVVGDEISKTGDFIHARPESRPIGAPEQEAGLA